jgi:uncharacterized Zn-binding protein involved in type VI secretion
MPDCVSRTANSAVNEVIRLGLSNNTTTAGSITWGPIHANNTQSVTHTINGRPVKAPNPGGGVTVIAEARRLAVEAVRAALMGDEGINLTEYERTTLCFRVLMHLRETE